MKTLRVMVLERDEHLRRRLVAQLCGQGVEQVDSAGSCREFPDYRDGPGPDVLICGLSLAAAGCADMLRRISALRHTPNLVLHGPVADLEHQECLFQRLGLRYLGHLPCPVQEERLRRMLLQVRGAVNAGPGAEASVQ